jgi:hypothetical protein
LNAKNFSWYCARKVGQSTATLAAGAAADGAGALGAVFDLQPDDAMSPAATAIPTSVRKGKVALFFIA